MTLFSRFKKIVLVVVLALVVFVSLGVSAAVSQVYQRELVRVPGGDSLKVDHHIAGPDADQVEALKYVVENSGIRYLNDLDRQYQIDSIRLDQEINTDGTIRYYLNTDDNRFNGSDDNQRVLVAVVREKNIYIPKEKTTKEGQADSVFANQTIKLEADYKERELETARRQEAIRAAQERLKQQQAAGDTVGAAETQKEITRLKNENDNQVREDKKTTNSPVDYTYADEVAAREKCDGPIDYLSNLAFCVQYTLAIISNIVFKLSAYVLGVAGTLLDYSIELSVNSAEFLKSLNVVEPMWTFIRDVLNMTFIFILLWIAINMVLGRAGISGGKTYTLKTDVRNVVLVAILINFSLFFAKMFVDGSNLVTLEIYQYMKPAESSVTGDGSIGISDQIMNTVGLQTLTSLGDVFDGGAALPAGCGTVPAVALAVGIFGSIFVLILAVAFGLAAILFIIRLPNMIYLFISSPFWIWGYSLKMSMFEKAKKTWVENMTHLCVFPIVYMLWMLVGLFAFKQFFGAKSSEGTFLTLLCKSTENGGGFTKSLSVILIFCIVIYTMMQAIKYAMTKGAGTGLLAPAAQKVIDRAGKLQKNLTSGVYEKSKGLARVAATPLVYAKDGVVNTTRRGTSFLSNKVADRFGRRAEDAKGELGRKFYAGLSSKFRNPKLFGQTQEDAEKARTKGEEEKYNKYVQVLKDSGAFKIEGEKAWIKKNGGTAADYKKYADEKAEKIMKTQLGDSIMNADNGSGVIHKDAILANMYDVEKDASGAVISQKFNGAKLWQSIDAAAKYHTTGDGKDVLDAKKAQAKRMGLAGMSIFDYKHLKAKAQIDELKASRAELGSKANKKQGKVENLKRKEKDVVRMQSKLQFMPTEANIELVVSSPNFRLNQNEYNKKVREFQKEYVKSGDLRLTVDERTAAKSKADRLKREVDEERSKAEERLSKLKEEVINLSAEEEAK